MGFFAGFWHLFGALVNYKQPIFPLRLKFFSLILSLTSCFEEISY
jgi:hypothetical protein